MRVAILVLILLSTTVAFAEEKKPGPIGEPSGPTREQLHWVPYPAPPASQSTLLLMRVCRPAGDEPARLAFVNHGSPALAMDRAGMQPTQCQHDVTRWFLERGFVVAYPMRRGYGGSGGEWVEGNGPCENPDFRRAGLTTANDMQAALRYAQDLPYVRKDGAFVVGQSAGGWGTIALASRNPASVAAFVNFAGGRGGHRNNQPGNNCSPEALVESAGEFGKLARHPMLWVYTSNDSFFGPKISRAMHEAFTLAGGTARFEMLSSFDRDGHGLFFGNGGVRAWGPVVDRFLAETGPR